MALHANSQSTRTNPAEATTDRVVRLYPNPATAYITFDLKGHYQKGLSLTIYNGILGKKMFEAASVPEKTVVNLNEFNRGIYIYHLVDNNGRILESGKFQVSN
jgi:Secretion system C-terminal sorting domain